MKARILRALALAASAALPACGVGGIAAVAAGGGGGGGGGGSEPPPPPTSTVTVPTGTSVANLVPFAFQLRDPQVKGSKQRPGGDDDPRTEVVLEWQRIDPDRPDLEFPWLPMTEATVESPAGASEGTRGLALGQHTFVWNTIPDLGSYRGRVNVRVRAEYEEASGIDRTFRSRPAVFTIDNRLCATLLGEEVQPPSDVETLPVDLVPDGDGFLVACLGANVVERVDADGIPLRVVGLGVAGDTTASGRNPGVARLPTLLALAKDSLGNLYTNHGVSVVVSNLGAAPLDFGSTAVPPRTTLRGIANLSSSRGVRFHPTGALLHLVGGTELRAFNPQDPADLGSTAIVLAGVSIAPGDSETLAGGGGTDADGAAGLATLVTDAVALAVGPDGEVYYAERGLGRVRVLNTGAAPVVVGGASVAPGTVRTVAGSGVLGFSGDGGPATAALLNLPGSLDVSADRALFVADAGNARIRLANLGPAQVTFADPEAADPVDPGEIATVVGGGTGGVGSKARDLQLVVPNAVALDAQGHLLVADVQAVVFVNGGTTTVTSYGRTASPGRTAKVYDAIRRGGIPLADPRAAHSNSPTEVVFSDRSTIRVLNLAGTSRVFGGNSADPGAIEIVGGGAVPGFSGDGGPARAAAFSFPSALALEGPRRLYAADTGNDRIRLLNLGDPRQTTAHVEVVLGVTVGPGNVDTVVGGAAGPLLDDGDGSAALGAVLDGPEGVAVGPDGLVWVADTLHHRIRVVNPGAASVVVAGVPVAAGTIETIVGTGTAGFDGDGALPRSVNAPAGLAIDNLGVVYFADRGNARVRALNATGAAVTLASVTIPPGEVATLVGTGVPGNLGDGGEGPSAQITSPRALFVQTRASDNLPAALYLSDEGAHVVRMLNLIPDEDLPVAVDFQGRTVTTAAAASMVTIAGGPVTPGFPNSPAFSGDGQPAEQVRLAAPFGIAVTNVAGDPAHFFVADRGNRRIRRFGAPPLK